MLQRGSFFRRRFPAICGARRRSDANQNHVLVRIFRGGLSNEFDSFYQRLVLALCRPLADNILLKAAEAEDTTASGIILATTNKEKSAIFEVVSAGPEVKDITAGTQVVVGQFMGSDIKLDGVSYKFVKQKEILATVTE